MGGEWDGSELLFGFQSFTVPQTVYRFDLKTKESSRWGQVKADIDFDRYTVEQVTFQSKDKTPLTMFLAHKKGIEKDGKNPTLLYGYGGFNIALTPTFNASRFLFLERGGVFAIANLRGGSEYGEGWHKAGMLAKKQNVFDDFLAAVEWLINEKYTSKDKLAVQGRTPGRQQRRPGRRRAAAAAAGLVQGGRLPGAAVGHGALPQVPDRPPVDRRVRLARRRAAVQVVVRVFAVSSCEGRHGIPGDAA